MKRLSALFSTVAFMLLSTSCQPQAAPDTRAADEQAIRNTEVEWNKAFVAKDVDRFVTFYADDASVLPPNMPIATDKAAIRAAVAPMFSAPGFAMTFQTSKVEVARSGDLAYTQGTYSMTMNDPKGKPMEEKGKYLTVYRKQADGTWKAIADTFNSDAPPPAPAK